MEKSWSSPRFREPMGDTRAARRPSIVGALVVALAVVTAGLTGCSGSGSSDGLPADDGQNAREAVVSEDQEGSDRDVTADSDATGVDRRREVRLGLTDWTGSRINVAIAELLIERRLGYPVTLVPVSEFTTMFDQLEAGELDAVLELWPSSLTDGERDYLDNGQVEDLGPLGVVGQIGWYVPSYVVEANPGLSSWEDLTKPGAATQFATAETGAKGRFLGTDPSYEQFDEDLIAALDLDFEVVYSGSEDGTRTELALAAARQDPILLYWWTPTAEIVEYDLVNVALPPRDQDCLDAHEAGRLMSCGYPEDLLFKVATSELAVSDPELHRFLGNFTLSTEDQLDMIHAVERAGESINSVAQEWVSENESTWSQWLTTG